MKKAINILFSCGVLACVPLVAQADLKIVNHTKASATAMAFNPSNPGALTNNTCSSTLGASGIITPDYNDSKPYIIPNYAINMACNPTCEVSIFMDRACKKTTKIAVGQFSIEEGITEVTPVLNADGYYVKQTGKNSISLEASDKKAPSIFDVMFKKLGL